MDKKEVLKIAREALSEDAGIMAGMLVNKAADGTLLTEHPDAHEKMAFFAKLETQMPKGSDAKGIVHRVCDAVFSHHSHNG